jgi:hypothetical protein
VDVGRLPSSRLLVNTSSAVQRADGAKRGQVVAIEHWLEEIFRKEK